MTSRPRPRSFADAGQRGQLGGVRQEDIGVRQDSRTTVHRPAGSQLVSSDVVTRRRERGRTPRSGRPRAPVAGRRTRRAGARRRRAARTRPSGRGVDGSGQGEDGSVGWLRQHDGEAGRLRHGTDRGDVDAPGRERLADERSVDVGAERGDERASRRPSRAQPQAVIAAEPPSTRSAASSNCSAWPAPGYDVAAQHQVGVGVADDRADSSFGCRSAFEAGEGHRRDEVLLRHQERQDQRHRGHHVAGHQLRPLGAPGALEVGQPDLQREPRCRC